MAEIKIFPAGILKVDEMFTDFGGFYMLPRKIEIYRYLANFDKPSLLSFKHWEGVIVIFLKNESGIIDQKLFVFKRTIDEMGMTPKRALDSIIKSDELLLWCC